MFSCFGQKNIQVNKNNVFFAHQEKDDYVLSFKNKPISIIIQYYF